MGTSVRNGREKGRQREGISFIRRSKQTDWLMLLQQEDNPTQKEQNSAWPAVFPLLYNKVELTSKMKRKHP
jgi:hypothetical protein